MTPPGWSRSCRRGSKDELWCSQVAGLGCLPSARPSPIKAAPEVLTIGSVGLCLVLWIRAKTVDQDERGNAERRALFAGLWPPTLWLIDDSLRSRE